MLNIALLKKHDTAILSPIIFKTGKKNPHQFSIVAAYQFIACTGYN
jgi:hypothetical protein